MTLLFFGSKPAFSTKIDKKEAKNCQSRQGAQEGGLQRRGFLEKAAKQEKIVEILLKMEDVPGKKVLDFFGRIVHNEGYPLNQTKISVAKLTSKTEKRHGPGGMKRRSAE
nr:hypothetical protein [uncultured Oscillibacter sp.]